MQKKNLIKYKNYTKVTRLNRNELKIYILMCLKSAHRNQIVVRAVCSMQLQLIMTKSKLTKYKSSCIATGKQRSVFNDFGLSRQVIKTHSLVNNLTTYKIK